MSEERISIREYARRVGVSDTAVRKCIKAEKIVRGVVYDANGKPYIIPSIANAEWAKSYDPSYERVTQSGGRATVYSAAPQPIEDAVAPPSTNQTTDTSLAAARRAQAVYKAKILEMEMKQKQGSLVNKDQVYKELFEAGKELRQSFEKLPDRIIDDILAARTRNDAHLILKDSIFDILNGLTEMFSREISIKR
jgi:predicted transcriptional regulator